MNKNSIFKKSENLKPGVKGDQAYFPDQTVWFTDETSADWKLGNIESRDQHPDSHWLINTENDHRIRRNKHNIKPRYPPRMIQPLAKQAVHETINQYSEKLEEQPPYESKELPDEQPEPAPANRILTLNEARAETKKEPRRSGRIPKSNKRSDFVYSVSKY